MRVKKEQNKKEIPSDINIGIFSIAYAPFVGGAEVALSEITRRMPPNYRFTCFTYKFDKLWPKQEQIGNVEVVRLGKGSVAGDYYGHGLRKMWYSLAAWRAAERAHRKKPFFAIWAMMAAYGGIGALLFKLRHPEVPILLTLQEGDSEAHILKRVGIFYPLWKMIFKKADRVQVISNYLGEFAKKYGATAPIDVVPNGVDLDGIKNSESRIKGRKINREEKIIITTSRLVHKNGVDVLIKAFAKLIERYPVNARLLILGSGPDEGQLKSLARKKGVFERVEFLGHVSPEKVGEYLEAADIFVRPSRSEGLGNSFLEAMSAKLPVVGTPVGGIPDFLRDPSQVGIARATGLMSKVDNENDLAEKIYSLMANKDLYSHLAKNGFALVKKEYSWDYIAERMLDIFNKLTKRA